jgi:type II secretory pathway pseudopilin PulG
LKRRGNERGLTLIEVVAAIALLGAVVAPITRLIIDTGTSANQDRLEIEAINLAGRQMEVVQNESPYESVEQIVGDQGEVHTAYVASNGGKSTVDHLQYTLTATPIDEGGGSICASGAQESPLTPIIYQVTVAVGWAANGTYPVQQSTYVAVQSGEAALQDTYQIAVLVDNGVTAQAYAGGVPITVTGTGGTLPVPAGQATNETVETDPHGCAFFPNLDANGWTYTYSIGTNPLGGNPDVVDYQDYPGIVNGSQVAVPMPGTATPTLKVGVPVVIGPLDVSVGTDVTITPYTVNYSNIVPASSIPVTLQNSALPMQQVGGLGTFSYDLTSTDGPINSMLVYPYQYSVWAGDSSDSYPGNAYYSGGVTKQLITTSAPATASIQLPVYPITFSIGSVPSGSVTLKEVNSPESVIELNAFVKSGSSYTDPTGVPLGQYYVDYSVSGHTASPSLVWVTPAGVCTETATQSSPPTGSTCSAAPKSIPLTIS